MYRLPPNLITFLNDRGINSISNIVDLENTTIFANAWKSSDFLGITVQWHQNWVGYTSALTKSHVHIKEENDELIWEPKKNEIYSSKDGYPTIYAAHEPLVLAKWWCTI